MATSHPRGTILRCINRLNALHDEDWIVLSPTSFRRFWWDCAVEDKGHSDAKYTVLGRLPPHLVETADEWWDGYRLPNCHLEDPKNNPVEWRPEGFWAVGLPVIEQLRTPKSQLRPGTVFRLKTPHKSFAAWGEVGEWYQPLVVVGNNRFGGHNKGSSFRRLKENNFFWGSVAGLPDDLEIIGQLPEDDMDATEFPVSKNDHTEPTVEVRDIMPEKLPVGTVFRFNSIPERWNSTGKACSAWKGTQIVLGPEERNEGKPFKGIGQPFGKRDDDLGMRFSFLNGVLPTDDIEILDEVRDMTADRVKELEKEVEIVQKDRDNYIEVYNQIKEAWFTLTGSVYKVFNPKKENIDRARASMEASNTNRPEGRKMSFMKKLLIVFTVGTLAGGNVGNIKDMGVAVSDYFHGPNEIIAGEFVAAPICKDCSEIFAADSQVVICGKCGSEKIGKVVYAPLYRDRGFPLTDQQVGIQIKNDDGSKSVVLETGEKIEVEK